MGITTQSHQSRHVLEVQGRVDANWAEQGDKAIDSAIRAGHHQLDLDFAQVNYISSAGIRVLLKYHKRLRAARGGLRVIRPPQAVLLVLQLSGIAETLVARDSEGTAPPGSRASGAGDLAVRQWAGNGIQFESYDVSTSGPLEVALQGRPESFAAGTLSAMQCHRLRCTADVVAVGLGAFSD